MLGALRALKKCLCDKRDDKSMCEFKHETQASLEMNARVLRIADGWAVGPITQYENNRRCGRFCSHIWS